MTPESVLGSLMGRDFTDVVALIAFGSTRDRAWGESVCIRCKSDVDEDALNEDDGAEYSISALCPECFAALFPEEER